MPTYQYACTDNECGHVFEQVQSFTDDPLTVCPECQGRLRKVFNAVGVVFKGSGFYRTDSRSEGRKDPGSGTSAADGKGTSSTTTDGGSSGSGTSGSSSAPSSSGSSSTATATAGAGAGAA